MNLTRILKHLLLPPWIVRRAFPAGAMASIERATREAEEPQLGEIRFVVEATLDFGALLRGQSARERAVEVFSALRVWDTEHNSGVLIYLLLADRDVEIVADRGVAAKVVQEDWEAICSRMEAAFREGKFEAGAIAGIREVGALLARYFPAQGVNPDELPDRPAVL
ncbi:MAG: TPM domain-containing protein [Betaproteobacteria bacterium]|nr:TPM domain-containing protein [Betaproteobacteria bacterium]